MSTLCSRLSRLIALLLLSALPCLAKPHHHPKPSPTPASTPDSSLPTAPPAPAASSLNVPAGPANEPGVMVPPNAGSHGFVKVDPGTERLVFEDGTPARFFGVNFAEYMSEYTRKVPTEEMDVALDDLKDMGVNLIRFQTYDNRIQNGAFGKGLNPVALENRDRFIGEAKKRGIYFHMSMNTANEGPGGAKEIYEKMGGNRESLVLIDQFINDQKTFAKNLLDHVNPYTGLAYKDEPAIVSIQLGNEQHAYSRANWGGTWTNFTGPMADELRAKWNKYLADKYGSRDKLAAAWGPLLAANEDPTKGTVAITNALYPDWKNKLVPTARQKDAVAFGDHMEDRFLKIMRDAIRNGAGDQKHLISDNGWVRGDDTIRATARKDLDLMDVQHYWPHGERRRLSPEETLIASPIKTSGINILNSLLSAREVGSVKGPGFVTEYNSHKDNQRLFQVVPVHAVMAQLTGIDGVALWTYGDGTADIRFNKDHWFGFNRETADLKKELMPFLLGSYLWRAGIPELINQDTIKQLATWDNTNPIGLSVDYDAAVKQAVTVKAYENPKEGITIDFPNDKMLVDRPNAIFYTGSGPVTTSQFTYRPLDNSTPYFVAAFPVNAKTLADAGEWRIFVDLDGTMDLKRADFKVYRSTTRGYESTHGPEGSGVLKNTHWEVRRPENAIYYDLKTQAFADAQKKALKEAKREDENNEPDE